MASCDIKMYNYLDDLICAHKHQKAGTEFDIQMPLFEFLGIPINPKKVVPPSLSLTCMGIEVDLDLQHLCIPEEKSWKSLNVSLFL